MDLAATAAGDLARICAAAPIIQELLSQNYGDEDGSLAARSACSVSVEPDSDRIVTPWFAPAVASQFDTTEVQDFETRK